MLLASATLPGFSCTGCHALAGTESWGGEHQQLFNVTQGQEEEQLGCARAGVGGSFLCTDHFLQLGLFLRLISGASW